MKSKIAIIILSVLVVGLGGFIAYDKLSNKEDKKENTVTNTPIVTDSGEVVCPECPAQQACPEQKPCTNDIVLDNKTKIESSAGITIEVVNGNIKFSDGNSVRTFEGTNAKYIYMTTLMDSSTAVLYYITNDNALYVLSVSPFNPSNPNYPNGINFFNKQFANYGVEMLNNVEGFIDDMSVTSSYEGYDPAKAMPYSSKVVRVLTKNNSIVGVSYNF